MKIIKNNFIFSAFALSFFFVSSSFSYGASTNQAYPPSSYNNQNEVKVSDSQIVSQIKKKFSNDKMLHARRLQISSKNGDVTLQGNLDTDLQYEQAVMLAESVQGVRNVDVDKVNVKESDHPLDDALITAKIKGQIIRTALFGDKDVKYWSVNIETKNGVVHLSGSVDNSMQKKNLIDLARNIKDVKSVQAEGLAIGTTNNNDMKKSDND